MSEQYYCLHLDDYSAAAFTSFGKAYYGTMEDLKAFIDTLDKGEETHERFEKLIGAFRAYEAGNTAVTHSVPTRRFLCWSRLSCLEQQRCG